MAGYSALNRIVEVRILEKQHIEKENIMKTKFKVGDLVMPTERAPKWALKGMNWTKPKKISKIDRVYVSGFWRSRSRRGYDVGGTLFLAEELKKVKAK